MVQSAYADALHQYHTLNPSPLSGTRRRASRGQLGVVSRRPASAPFETFTLRRSVIESGRENQRRECRSIGRGQVGIVDSLIIQVIETPKPASSSTERFDVQAAGQTTSADTIPLAANRG